MWSAARMGHHNLISIAGELCVPLLPLGPTTCCTFANSLGGLTVRGRRCEIRHAEIIEYRRRCGSKTALFRLFTVHWLFALLYSSAPIFGFRTRYCKHLIRHQCIKFQEATPLPPTNSSHMTRTRRDQNFRVVLRFPD